MPINDEAYLRHSRQIAYTMSEFMLWHMSRIRGRFAGDIECALILGEIAHYNARAAFPNHHFGEAPRSVPDEHARELLASLKRCNTLSISLATGIPRETVRRKIRWLEEQGWVAKDGKDAKGGLIVATEVHEQFRDFNRETLERFLATADELRRLLDGPPPAAMAPDIAASAGENVSP